MTTDTGPLIEHAIPAARLAPLLHDRQRVCEVPTRHHDGKPPAAWVISGVCSLCGPETLLACERCKRRFERSGARCEAQGVRPVRITWMEPL